MFDNPERIPYGPVDPEFQLLQTYDASGKLRALLLHDAAHPVVLGPTICLDSADYPGAVQARVESALPGVQAMFVQGAAGNINPLFQGRTGDLEKDFATMTNMGHLLAAEVLRALPAIRPLEDRPASILVRIRQLTFQDRWEDGKTMTMGISTVLINGQLAIAAVPGKPFLGMQSMWKRSADAALPLFYGYTQSTPDPWPGHIPDICSAALGGCGADTSTKIEVGSAERIMDSHWMQRYDLAGNVAETVRTALPPPAPEPNPPPHPKAAVRPGRYMLRGSDTSPSKRLGRAHLARHGPHLHGPHLHGPVSLAPPPAGGNGACPTRSHPTISSQIRPS